MHRYNDKRVFDKEARSLADAGFHITHLCPGLPTQAGTRFGVSTVTFVQKSGLIGRLKQLRMIYRMAIEIDADVYHCNEVDSWFIGVVLKLFRGKLCVFDVHEHYPSTFAESRFPLWLRPYISHLVCTIFHLLTPFTDRLVLAKRSVADDFKIQPDRKVLVQNYAPLTALKFKDALDTPSLKSEYVLVHLGLFSKIRGWPQVLDALSKMRHQNLSLLVIGEINDGTMEEFSTRVNELGLSSRVKLLDWLPYDLAFTHLLNSDIGIVAFQPGVLNHVYAMPHKMFDYMAAGLAVLLPHFAVEVAPVIKETECGFLFDSSDSEDLAIKLDSLLDDPASMLAMGMRGRTAVHQRYNWEAEAENLIRMYRDLEQQK